MSKSIIVGVDGKTSTLHRNPLNREYRDAVIPSDLAERIHCLKSNLTLSTQLLDRFPVDIYVEALQALSGYKQIPHEMREWSRRIEHEFGRESVERYHQLLLLELMQRFDEISSRKAQVYPASILKPFRIFFAGILRDINEPLQGNFLHGRSGFDKDLGVCSQCLTPCGAQLVDRKSGVERRNVYRRGLKQGLRLSRLMLVHIGGFKPLYEMHMDVRRLLMEFNPSGWNACYRRIAELMEVDQGIKGVCGSSWWFDPQLSQVSPRLAFLHQVPLKHGAQVFDIGSDETSTQDAIRNSPERQRQFEQGTYLPKKYLLVWGRNDLLSWKASADYD